MQERRFMRSTMPGFHNMMLGYPKYRFHRLPERKSSKIFWK